MQLDDLDDAGPGGGGVDEGLLGNEFDEARDIDPGGIPGWKFCLVGDSVAVICELASGGWIGRA